LCAPVLAALPALGFVSDYDDGGRGDKDRAGNIQFGPRPFFLVVDMNPRPRSVAHGHEVTAYPIARV
jgi:hypothetical protein